MHGELFFFLIMKEPAPFVQNGCAQRVQLPPVDKNGHLLARFCVMRRKRRRLLDLSMRVTVYNPLTEWRETVPHVSEPLFVDTQLLCHKHFIWLHSQFYGSNGRSRIDFVATPPSVQFSRIFVNFTAGRRLQLIPTAGPRYHMPLTMDLVTNGMRHSPDPMRGRWDYEKIEEMPSDPVARLTFFKELETNNRNSSIVGLAATEATPDDAWENLVQIFQETAGPYLHQWAQRPTRPLALERRRLLLELGTARRLTGSSGDQSLVENAKTQIDATFFSFAFEKTKGNVA